MSGIKVVDVMPADIVWHFNTGPRYVFGQNNSYSQEIDPFPAYRHNHSHAYFALRRCQDEWPLDVDIVYHLSPYEDTNRTNGWSTTETIWGRNEEPNISIAHVWLSGKRIPPHPAVTRYVVPHEYGHHVQWDIERRRGLSHNALLEEYAKLRGLEEGRPINGTGGVWHKAIGEIFACDFRTVVMAEETNYWPHDGAPQITPTSRVWSWWKDQAQELRWRASAA